MAAGALLLALALASWACPDLLKVQSPLQVPADDLNDPKKASMLALSVQADFECAFGNYVAITAALTDEFASSAPAVNSLIELRLRRQLVEAQNQGCTEIVNQASNQWYVPLQTARLQAEQNYQRLRGFPDSLVAAPGKAALMATVAAYAGFVYTLFGEGTCATAFDLQAPIAPAAILAIAERRFTTADSLAQLVTAAAQRTELRNFAHVGRARVRLDLGQRDSAAADARFVAANYVRDATFSTSIARRQNQVYVRNLAVRLATVDPRFRNLQIAGVPDPRVPARDAGRNGSDGVTRLWSNGKYTTDASPIPLATWDEAQLIIAEAEGGASAVTRINNLRTKYALPVFASADPDTIVAQVREERRRQLFVQGHRLNDMLRFGLPFDTGPGYGNVTCLPPPTIETANNPNFP